MGQNFLIGVALHRHSLRAVLAHAHPVAVAPGGDADIVSGFFQGEGCGAEVQKLPKLRSCEGLAGDFN